MKWVYDIEACIRYDYPNEPRGPERPNLPPTPPAGWPEPRVGDIIGVPGEEPFKVRVIGIEWDYAVPEVTVQLEVVQREAEPDPLDENDHRDRNDRYGYTWTRNPGGCWHSVKRDCRARHCGWTLAYLNRHDGPLTFTPEDGERGA